MSHHAESAQLCRMLPAVTRLVAGVAPRASGHPPKARSHATGMFFVVMHCYQDAFLMASFYEGGVLRAQALRPLLHSKHRLPAPMFGTFQVLHRLCIGASPCPAWPRWSLPETLGEEEMLTGRATSVVALVGSNFELAKRDASRLFSAF